MRYKWWKCVHEGIRGLAVELEQRAGFETHNIAFMISYKEMGGKKFNRKIIARRIVDGRRKLRADIAKIDVAARKLFVGGCVSGEIREVSRVGGKFPRLVRRNRYNDVAVRHEVRDGIRKDWPKDVYKLDDASGCYRYIKSED